MFSLKHSLYLENISFDYLTPVNIGVVVTVDEEVFELQVLFIACTDSDIEIVIVYPPVSESHGHIFLNNFECSDIRFPC